MHSIQNKFSFPLEIKVTSRRKTIGIRIKDSKAVIYTPSFVTMTALEMLIKKKSNWIEKHLSNDSSQGSNQKAIYILGKKYFIQDGDDPNIKGVSLDDILAHQESENIIIDSNLPKKAVLKQWYNIQARKLIVPRVTEISKRVNLVPSSVEFKFFKSQWGNCDIRKKIKLNILLLMCPLEVIDYVIIHELCHLKEMNHSPKFWALVSKHCPEYKDAIKSLKAFKTSFLDFS